MKTQFYASVGAFALAIPALSGNAIAAEAQADAEQPASVTSEDILVVAAANRAATSVATRVPLENMATPFTVAQVSEEIIEETGARSLSEALRYAGIVGGTDNFGNAGEFFSSRGFQLAAGRNYFRDGLRYRKYGSVALYDIERLEMLRGPASVIYGALEPGGVLNMVSRKPQDEAAATVRLRAGSWDYFQGTVDATGPITDGINFRVQGLYEDAGSFRDHVESNSKGLTGTLDAQITPTTLVTLRASWFDDTRTGDRGVVMAYDAEGRFETSSGRKFDFADVPRSRFLGEKFGTYDFRDINLQLSLRQKLTDNWELRGDVIRSDQKEDRTYIWAIPTDQIVGDNGMLTRQIGDWDARLKGTLGRIELAGSFSTGPIDHKILIGTEYEHFKNSRVDQRYQFAAINIYDPVYMDSRPANGAQTQNSRPATLFESKSIYLQDVMEIGDHFVVLAGLRYDHVADYNIAVDPRRRTQIVDGLTPQAGLVWRPTPYVSPYVSYTRSFVPQSGTSFAGDPFEPEKGEQWEGGVKFDVRSLRTLITTSVFSLDRNNLTVSDPDNPGYSVLLGRHKSKGFEFSLDANPIDPLRITVNWNHLFEAEYVRHNTLAGNAQPNAPKNAVGIFASYNLESLQPGLTVNAGANYVGKRYGVNTNTFWLPAYTTFDVGARYKLNQTVSLMANIRNLTDKTYYTGSSTTTSILVGAPRSFTLELKAGF